MDPPVLLFATKSGTRVTVRALKLQGKTETVVLMYDERAEAAHSGNLWEERPPSVALTNDGHTLAFTSDDGLYTFDIAAGSRKTLISQTAPGESEGVPTWSPDVGDGTFGLHSPHWSPDGRYLAFEMSHYEGSAFGFYDRLAGRFFEQEGLPHLSYVDPELGALSWAGAGASTAVPRNGETIGVYLSEVGDPSTARFLRDRDHPRIASAALSVDASEVSFTFAKKPDSDAGEGLATMHRDGTGLRIIDTTGAKSTPFFDAVGDVWWLEDGRLLRWNGSSAAQVARVDASFHWEILSIDEAGLSLAGRSRDDGRARFLLLDPRRGTPLHSHDSDTDFTTYLGVT